LLPDLVAMNDVLKPFLEPLFRLAVRGHWLREHRPVRISTQVCGDGWLIPPQTRCSLQPTASVDTAGDLRMVLEMNSRGVRYPLGPYPEIQEFSAMLRHLGPERPWRGIYFQGTAEVASPDRPCPILLLEICG
jgi:hypothetical protein